jgi:phosphatidylserine/phosphatidylglycerophosphate/cardiolipin synthase-like enzyme
MSRRNILRSYNRSNVAVRELLAWVFAAEAVNPSTHIWIAMGWISDVVIFDASQGQFDAVSGRGTSGRVHVSDLLVIMARKGTKISVVTRPDSSNQVFLEALKRKARGTEAQSRIQLHLSPEVHHKNIVGEDWFIDGSMNLTANGLDNNVESLTLMVDRNAAAELRTNIREQWKNMMGPLDADS